MAKDTAKNAFFIIGAIVLIGFFVVYMGWVPKGQNTLATKQEATNNVAAVNTCPVQPSITVVGTDAITLAAATPTTTNYIVDGVSYGTTAPALTAGKKVDMIGDLAGYLADQQQIASTVCGAQPATFHPYAYANATVTIKDDPVSSSNTLSNGGGVYNATKINGQRNLPVIFQGTSQKSTGKIFWVVESSAGNLANITTIAATCNGAALSPVTIPAAIGSANANSYRTAFEVPALIGATSVNCNLQLQSTATGVMNGLFKNTFYAEQKFVDASGQIQEGVYDTTPNGNNAAKYQDTYTYNVFLG